jgi:hypothetical protein
MCLLPAATLVHVKSLMTLERVGGKTNGKSLLLFLFFAFLLAGDWKLSLLHLLRFLGLLDPKQ